MSKEQNDQVKFGGLLRPRDSQFAAEPVCPHKNLVIFEQKAGKIVLDNQLNKHIDWSSNVINAHYLRVTKYLCVDCMKIIPAPTDAKDEI